MIHSATRLFLIAIAMFASAALAHAQGTFPSRPITLVVPLPACRSALVSASCATR